MSGVYNSPLQICWKSAAYKQKGQKISLSLSLSLNQNYIKNHLIIYRNIPIVATQISWFCTSKDKHRQPWGPTLNPEKKLTFKIRNLLISSNANDVANKVVSKSCLLIVHVKTALLLKIIILVIFLLLNIFFYLMNRKRFLFY